VGRIGAARAATAVIVGRVGLLRPTTLDLGPTTMTDDKIALGEMLEKGSDATSLREMLGFAAQRLMELVKVEVAPLSWPVRGCGSAVEVCT
jgi:hypothetical protein